MLADSGGLAVEVCSVSGNVGKVVEEFRILGKDEGSCESIQLCHRRFVVVL